MLKKEVIRPNDSCLTLIGNSDSSSVFRMSDGRIAKYFSPLTMMMYGMLGVNIYGKLDSCQILSDVKEFYLPTSAIFSNGSCVGYTMDVCDGISFNDMDDKRTITDRADVSKYMELHRKINELVRKCNSRGVLLPDLLTLDNVFIKEDGSLGIIDVDGLQIRDYPALAMSTSLGDTNQYYNCSKYCKDKGKMIWTSELDKKSLIHLFFLDVLNMDLNKIGQVDPFTGKLVRLEDLLELVGLDNNDMINVIRRNISSSSKGLYLDQFYTLFEDNYYMYCIPMAEAAKRLGHPTEGLEDKFLKKLVPKR